MYIRMFFTAHGDFSRLANAHLAATCRAISLLFIRPRPLRSVLIPAKYQRSSLVDSTFATEVIR